MAKKSRSAQTKTKPAGRRTAASTSPSRHGSSLVIQIAKRADGAGVLKCIRADGTSTWQKQSPRHAAFFSLHDLTHFAVETTLGLKRAFFGLIAEGWDFDDTTGKGSRGPLPEDAGLAEQIVGLLEMERGGRMIWSVDEFNSFSARKLSADELNRVRAKRSELFERWHAVPVGSELELTLP